MIAGGAEFKEARLPFGVNYGHSLHFLLSYLCGRAYFYWKKLLSPLI
jgi:hypothetical protein